MEFRAQKTPLEGLLIIQPKIFTDQRGYFMESYRKRDFAELGIDVEFVQDNQSQST
ncbi:MAG: dTDP-4-dehydrorhamnose 3,5-epimerase family protein, partial [Deltaproteobacteria bacterium]|nr:dTDP-4-dehydrorhamnose 3,5-epimerase family protein [Deltaproteobacteria bacterium]